MLVDVRSIDLNTVESFVLRIDDGAEIRFRLSPDASRASHGVSPGHLRQHMANGDRFTVRYRYSDGMPTAIEIVEAS